VVNAQADAQRLMAGRKNERRTTRRHLDPLAVPEISTGHHTNKPTAGGAGQNKEANDDSR
jgi:hypothetical protein